MTRARRHIQRGNYEQALTAIRQAQEQIDQVAQDAVDGARERGHTWKWIADLLGVSQQAAHKRYSARARARRGQDSDPAT